MTNKRGERPANTGARDDASSSAPPPWLDRQLEKARLDERTALEVNLMFACGRALLESGRASAPREIAVLAARHSPDWGDFLDLLRENRFLPVVYRALNAARGCGVPEALSEAVAARWKTDSVRMLKMTAELVRMIKRFSENDLRVIAFKGPALAVQVYGAAGMRFSRDLDLLVAPEDHERAERLLRREGYAYEPGEIPFKAGLAHRLASYHTRLIHRESLTHVELHYHLLQETLPSVWPFDVLWQERASVQIAGTPVQTLPLPLHGLYLVLHGGQHSWERLIRPFDIAALCEVLGTTELTALADRHGLKARLMPGLLLVHLLFGLKIPEAALKMISDRRVRAYTELAFQMIVAPRPAAERPLGRRYWLRKRVRWAACITAREKRHYLAAHFLPEDVDIARLPLPNSLFFLHYALKPFWAFKRKLDGAEKRPH